MKQLTGYIEKAAESSDYAGTFVLSTNTPDRDGDIILQDGWQLENFQKNPIALWQHDYKAPVGNWENIRLEAGKLLADLKLGSTRLAQMTKQLIDDGVLRAVSVGFKPLDYEPLEDGNPMKGWLIKSAELLEASLVSVPANQEALLMSKSLGLTDMEQRLIFSTQPDPKSVGNGSISKSAKPTVKPKEKSMNLSEKIQQTQDELIDLREQLKTASEMYIEDATDENQETVAELTKQIQDAESKLKTMQDAEQAIMDQLPAQPAAAKTPNAPAKKPVNNAPAIVPVPR